MFSLLLIPHSDISADHLNEIIKLKSISWPYSYDDQVRWMKDHLKDNDIHALLRLDDSFVAYLNLIPINLRINGNEVSGLGVGNVCTRIKGRGWGKEIMLHANTYLEKNDKAGLLFCRDRLVDFYCMCRWKKVENSNLKVNFDNADVISMYFNYIEPVALLEFTGSIF